jgi:hypothetical protein
MPINPASPHTNPHENQYNNAFSDEFASNFNDANLDENTLMESQAARTLNTPKLANTENLNHKTNKNTDSKTQDTNKTSARQQLIDISKSNHTYILKAHESFQENISNQLKNINQLLSEPEAESKLKDLFSKAVKERDANLISMIIKKSPLLTDKYIEILNKATGKPDTGEMLEIKAPENNTTYLYLSLYLLAKQDYNTHEPTSQNSLNKIFNTHKVLKLIDKLETGTSILKSPILLKQVARGDNDRSLYRYLINKNPEIADDLVKSYFPEAQVEKFREVSINSDYQYLNLARDKNIYNSELITLAQDYQSADEYNELKNIAVNFQQLATLGYYHDNQIDKDINQALSLIKTEKYNSLSAFQELFTFLNVETDVEENPKLSLNYEGSTINTKIMFSEIFESMIKIAALNDNEAAVDTLYDSFKSNIFNKSGLLDFCHKHNKSEAFDLLIKEFSHDKAPDVQSALDFFIKENIDPNQQTNSYEANNQLLIKLSKEGLFLGDTIEKAQNALYQVAVAGNEDLIKATLEDQDFISHSNLVSYQNEPTKNNLLHQLIPKLTCSKVSPEIIKLLLEGQTNAINTLNKHGLTPYQLLFSKIPLSEQGLDKILDTANIMARQPTLNKHSRDNALGLTPLEFMLSKLTCINSKFLPATKIAKEINRLIKSFHQTADKDDLNFNLKDVDANYNTSLHYILPGITNTLDDDSTVIKYIVNEVFQGDINALNKENKTPLTVTLERKDGGSQTSEYLLKNLDTLKVKLDLYKHPNPQTAKTLLTNINKYLESNKQKAALANHYIEDESFVDFIKSSFKEVYSGIKFKKSNKIIKPKLKNSPFSIINSIAKNSLAYEGKLKLAKVYLAKLAEIRDSDHQGIIDSYNKV